MPTNVYEGRPNADVLEKQRKKYIQQELDWFSTKDGESLIEESLNAIAFGGASSEEEIDILIDKVLERLQEKVPQKGNSIDDQKFTEEFPREIIREEMVKRGIIDSEGTIQFEEIMNLNEKK